MQRCKNCEAILLPGANFCHKCGFPTKSEDAAEPIEQNQPTQHSLFDNITSDDLEELPTEVPTENFYNFDSSNTIEFELDNSKEDIKEEKSTTKLDFSNFKSLFFDALRARVVEEHNQILYSDYVERFYRSNFQKVMQSSIELWQEEVKRLKEKNQEDKIDGFQSKLLNKWLNYFIVKECADLNDVSLNEKILIYDELDPSKINFEQMIEDFLQLNSEKNIKVYKNFLAMPSDKLETAIKSFASVPRNERILFIADSSITGTCKEGFAMSNEAIYWKAPLEKAQRIEFQSLHSVQKNKDWIEINGAFFNIHRSLNLKLLRLLKTIMQNNLF